MSISPCVEYPASHDKVQLLPLFVYVLQLEVDSGGLTKRRTQGSGVHIPMMEEKDPARHVMLMSPCGENPFKHCNMHVDPDSVSGQVVALIKSGEMSARGG